MSVRESASVWVYTRSMKQLNATTWPDIFAVWRSREASNPAWIKTATEIKGWPDWESWRQFSVSQMQLDKRAWTVYELTDPMAEIPAMLVGPYSGWQKRFPVPNIGTFADLANNSKDAAEFMANDTIQRLQQMFPLETEFIGLRRPDGKIVLVEGHHRAMAVALAAHDGRMPTFGKVFIALADLTDADSGLMNRVLARGMSKEPRKE